MNLVASNHSSATSNNKRKKTDDITTMDDSVRQFYSDKTMYAANNKMPVLSMMAMMQPIKNRKDVKKFLNLELGVHCGKNLAFNRDGKKGGKILTATCVQCANFRCVWRSTRLVGFTIQPHETNLDHGFIDENGHFVDCGTLSHQATSVRL